MRGIARPSNIRLTCICGFATRKRQQSWRKSCIKKGAAQAATAQATFVTKQMSG